MAPFKTEQEEFWAGEFGDSYVDRNAHENLLANKKNFFMGALASVSAIDSAIELGANVGLNMMALRSMFPGISLAAVELNKKAFESLVRIPDISAYNESISNFTTDKRYSISISCGVMIHLNPESLASMYGALYQSSKKYIMLAEYYNPTPVMVPYRGHGERLFKRDFAGELMDRYKDLALLDYGFVYHRDPQFPLDDLTWFLFQKKETMTNPELDVK